MEKRKLLSLLALALASGPLLAQDSWITAGAAAYRTLRKVPGIKVLDSRTAASIAGSERVYLLGLPATAMLEASRRLHDARRHCGGYMQHTDESAGRRALAQYAEPVSSDVPVAGRPSYVIVNQAQVVPALAAMAEENLGQSIRDLSAFPNRLYNSADGVKASQWLMEQWTATALRHGAMTVEQVVHAGYAQRSVVATIPGSDLATEVVVLGAHLDSINVSLLCDRNIAPGADDDASGVAGLTEIMRVLADAHYRPRRTIKLIAYAAEEVGLRGSQEIARDFRRRAVNVVGVLQLDMSNYKGSAADIYLLTDYTDSAQNTFLASLMKMYLPSLTVGTDLCGYACSDHASWQAQGYATSMPFESALAGDNPHIHSKRDTYANSGNQAAHALKFARLGAAYAIELGTSSPSSAVPQAILIP